MIEEYKRKLLETLVKYAFFKEKVILSSGKSSDYYIDARRVTLSAPGAFYLGKIIFDMVKLENIDAVGGPTLGADPLVGAVAFESFQAGQPLNTFIIRQTPKAHGKQLQVEGPLLKQKARVVLIDDVATTGKAFVESIEVLKKYDIQVVKAVCVVDRKEGAKEALAKHHCPLESVFTIFDFPL